MIHAKDVTAQEKTRGEAAGEFHLQAGVDAHRHHDELGHHFVAAREPVDELILEIFHGRPEIPGCRIIEKGEILVNGLSLTDWDLEELRKHIGIVPQEVLLFGGSIRENIAYAKPNASEEEIILAAQKANAWQFISQFPEGLDTLVGERGVKLSGGQRQRVAIARAILKDPSLLVLDEATSSLDAESEALVQEALDELMKGRTTIIIAHRLATIRKVDRIYVLSEGKIVEEGSHYELAEKEDGFYSNLVRLQFADH